MIPKMTQNVNVPMPCRFLIDLQARLSKFVPSPRATGQIDGYNDLRSLKMVLLWPCRFLINLQARLSKFVPSPRAPEPRDKLMGIMIYVR